MISNSLSDKILKEAFKQQKEIVDEENEELNDGVATFSAVKALVDEEEEEDIDEFAGFSETQSQFDDYETVASERERDTGAVASALAAAIYGLDFLRKVYSEISGTIDA